MTIKIWPSDVPFDAIVYNGVKILIFLLDLEKNNFGLLTEFAFILDPITNWDMLQNDV